MHWVLQKGGWSRGRQQRREIRTITRGGQSQVCVCVFLCVCAAPIASHLFIGNQRHLILYSFSCPSYANRQEIVCPEVCRWPSIIAHRYENTIYNVPSRHTPNDPTAPEKKTKKNREYIWGSATFKGDLWRYIAFNPSIDLVALRNSGYPEGYLCNSFSNASLFPSLQFPSFSRPLTRALYPETEETSGLFQRRRIRDIPSCCYRGIIDHCLLKKRLSLSPQ